MPIIDLCVEQWIQEIHDQVVISFEDIIDRMRENKTKRRGSRLSTNSDRIALADLAEDIHVTLTSFSFSPKEPKLCIRCGIKPGIIGGYCVECNKISHQERKATRENHGLESEVSKKG